MFFCIASLHLSLPSHPHSPFPPTPLISQPFELLHFISTDNFIFITFVFDWFDQLYFSGFIFVFFTVSEGARTRVNLLLLLLLLLLKTPPFPSPIDNGLRLACYNLSLPF